MRTLIRFLIQYQFVLLFLLFEGFSLWLVANSNYFQRAAFGQFSRGTVGVISLQFDRIANYFYLNETNRQLVKENIELRHQLMRSTAQVEELEGNAIDSSVLGHFAYIPAQIISNSVNKQHNLLLLNVGKKQGVELEMGVVTADGVVGVVVATNNRFSSIISVLNIDLRISARLKKNRYFGSLNWDGLDYRYAQLADVPIHADIFPGDTVVTSGFSSIFPADITLGIVAEVDKSSGNFLKIRVALTNDFKKLDQVWVVKNNYLMEEQFLHEP